MSATKADMVVQVDPVNWALYQVCRGKVSSCGRWGCSPSEAGLPYVPGLRYRITFEIIGAGPAKPQLPFYWKNWYDPERQRRACNYFKSKKEQRKNPDCREHMRDILSQAKLARQRFDRDLRIWKQWKRSTP